VLSVFFLAILVVVVSTAVLLVYANSAVNKDVVSGIEIMNPGGNKTALVIYQPGLTSLQKDTSYAFGNGLAASGWRVEITTASPQAPSDLSKYGLLVLDVPTYNNSPGTAIVRYVDRVGDLVRVNTVIISIGASSPEKSVDSLAQKVQAANGTVEKLVALYEGRGSPADTARQAGTQIRP
jgi:hypothetical protein